MFFGSWVGWFRLGLVLVGYGMVNVHIHWRFRDELLSEVLFCGWFISGPDDETLTVPFTLVYVIVDAWRRGLH